MACSPSSFSTGRNVNFADTAQEQRALCMMRWWWWAQRLSVWYYTRAESSLYDEMVMMSTEALRTVKRQRVWKIDFLSW